jgi:hypothetical protein
MSQVFPGYIPQGAGGGQISNSGAGSNNVIVGQGALKHSATTVSQLYTDRQHQWLTEYKIDPITMGKMCDKFPALAKSWSQFKIVYELCRSEENNG